MAVRTSASIVERVKSVRSVMAVTDDSGRSDRSRAEVMAVVVCSALRGWASTVEEESGRDTSWTGVVPNARVLEAV
jgi:hypothetical protein